MKHSKQTGLAMVIVIWVLSLLTIMAASFALTMRRETTVVSALKDNAIILASAETGITMAQQMLLADENMRWRADGSIYQLQYQDAEIRVRLFSEHGKIDINKADEILLTKLLNSTAIELDQQQALVSAILDWRDKDDLVHINGAEKKQYEEAGLNYQPANKAFKVIDELQMVLGMNRTIFQSLQPLITVYSEQQEVDFELATKEVLQAVASVDSAVLDDYLLQRIENNRAQLPAPAFPLSDNTRINSKSLAQVYTVISQARINGELSGGIKVIIKKMANTKQQQSFSLLDWQQIYQQHSLFSEEMEQLLITQQNESEHNN